MMADNGVTKVTPTKIATRNPVCRLCGGCQDTRHMLRIFSKAGTSKNLCVKIKKLCGIEVSEDDSNSKVLCRQCVAFMNKMEDFIAKAQSLQEKHLDEFSVKRCMLQSPTQQPSKRTHHINQSRSSSAKQLFGTTTIGAGMTVETEASSNTQSRQAINILPKQFSEAGCSLSNTMEAAESLLTERQQQLITRASNTGYATVLADILAEHCPTVVNSIKKLICKDIRKSGEKLCRRSQGSILYGKDYESLHNFDFKQIWNELKTNLPFVVDIMNAVAKNDGDLEGTGHELMVKYSFVYSILMGERWHELSLVKRMITVLTIEGGCSKQVSKYMLEHGHVYSTSMGYRITCK